MAKYDPHYKVHRNKITGDYYVVLLDLHSTYTIKRKAPQGTKKIYYYVNSTWYPTLRDAIFSLI